MTQIQHPSAVALVLRRTFDAPRDVVFNAWTTPEMMKQFMGPGTCKEATVDLRVGGNYRIVMPTVDGEEFVAKGTYREVLPPQRIVCTWRWEEDDPKDEHDTLLTLEFNAKGNQTEVVLTHENFKDAESCERHQGGWTKVFDNYARLVG